MSNTIPERIIRFNEGRDKRTLPLKYAAMAEDPFRFFRGTCHLFYEDLLSAYPFPASPESWICGDLHIENFGSYKGADRLVYFDLNDFDEGLKAPVLWEIARLVTAVELAAVAARFSTREKKKLVEVLLQQYRQTLHKERSSFIQRETARGLIKKMMDNLAERKLKDLLKKRADTSNKHAKLLSTDRLLTIPPAEKKPLVAAFSEWFGHHHHGGFRVTDAGIRIAGTGSIGVKRYIFLLEQIKNRQKRLMIDIKQALPSALAPYRKNGNPGWKSEADRVIGVQEIMQQVSPAFLSSFQYENDWFVVREMQPMEDRVNISSAIDQPWNVENYLADLSTLTASAQLRGSGRRGAASADDLMEFAEDEKWPGMVKEWAVAYALQVKNDYSLFCNAWKEGYFKL
jgi:uncharacterized protein (DUF2252 family)